MDDVINLEDMPPYLVHTEDELGKLEAPEVIETPEGAGVVALWEDPQNDENVVPRDDAEATNETPEETSSPSTHTSGDASKSSTPHDASGGTRKARKRPLTTAQLLLESHKEDLSEMCQHVARLLLCVAEMPGDGKVEVACTDLPCKWIVPAEGCHSGGMSFRGESGSASSDKEASDNENEKPAPKKEEAVTWNTGPFTLKGMYCSYKPRSGSTPPEPLV
ncbi:hypothetical protein HPB50_008189 [Hyalomma asiaticum]|uniref:Uncharacterized protein n=1 Tax=Hyalomma asiaticum TaxID=266040 RepID=A0ACB7SD34_HYAAI|nr:hypothetical protein HPB50_008189 [Hyalomma asiaticum]